MTKDFHYIFQAAQDGDVEKIKQALFKGIDINARREEDANQSMLHYAASFNHLNLVKLLVESGININSEDKYGRTALHNAARKGAILIVQDLIENGAIVDKKNKEKKTPFNEAIYNNEIECAEFLLKSGANINNQYDSLYNKGITSLHFAIAGSYDYSGNLVKFLLKNGADPNVTDDNDDFVLFIAIEQKTLTSQLVKAVSNINLQDKNGKTALHLAAANHSLAPLKKLLKRSDIDFNILDNNGKNPLYYSNNESTAALLIKNGAHYDKSKEYDELFWSLYGEQHIDLNKLNRLVASDKDEKFEITKLINHIIVAIRDFAEKHQDETFYVFAIDGYMLSLNSEEAFEKTHKRYQTKFPEFYNTKEKSNDLKFNTGDFEYQGFSSFDEGFVNHYYEEHYNLPDEQQKNSTYAIAMDTLIKELHNTNAFEPLKLSNDFSIIRVEHTY